MYGRAHFTVCLALLTSALGYAVVTHGGGARHDANVTLLVIALAGIAHSFRSSPRHLFSKPERVLIVPLVLLPAYLAFQVVPLPLPVLRILSPIRAEIADALAGVVTAPQFAPLSIAPAGTWVHLARMLGYGVILLLVRQAVRDRDRSPWLAVVPLIVVGVLEAVWGLTRVVPDGSPTAGTYFNRNHFAGLLEMILPLALMCGFSALHRDGHGRFGAARAVTACALFAVAGVMFAAIASSFSKLGFVSTLASLFVMGVMALGRKLSAGKRWSLVGCLALLVLAAFVFLSPAELVSGFGTLATEQSTENRLPVWKDTVDLIRAYPLFGIGAGNFFPALLRYQNTAPDLTWTHAHNDYLQWLSELGLVGSLIGGVLVCAVLGRAVRGALSEQQNPERRFLALACTGSLTAILIHSLGDFNTYVLANGMVLSWISGVAAGLAASDTRIQAAPSRSARFGDRYVLSAGWLLSGYAIASLLFIHLYKDNVKAERAFCTFGICDTDAALAGLRRQSGAATNEALQPDQLLAYLPRDSAAPHRWDELGAAMQKAGRTAEARYCFSRAVTLAPNSSPTLLTAADFHLRSGEVGRGLELAARSLKAGPTFDNAAFATLYDSHISVDDVLRHVATDRRSAQAYLRWLVANDNVTDVIKVWEWSISRGYADDKLAIEYVEFLMRKEMPEAAAKGWGRYAAGRSTGYPDTNRIFNGDFEADPTGSRFDWRIDKSRTGVAVGFDSDVRHSGARALRLRFDGTENVTNVGVEQWVYLEAGQYNLSAHIRTENVTTDEGLALKVASVKSEAELSFTTEAVRGTRDWTTLSGTFVAPSGGTLVRVFPVRRHSLKFDNLVRGTVWVDGLAIMPDAP